MNLLRYIEVHWIPILLCTLIPVTFFVTYGIALGQGHVTPFWPYISDTGTKPPESCIFGQLLNFAAALLGVIVYLRYRHVAEYLIIKPHVTITPLWNKVGLFLGMLSCLGLDVVANFQESNVLTVHLLGAAACFFSGTLYFILQTVFTWRMSHTPRYMVWLRFTFALLTITFTIMCVSPVGAARSKFRGKDIRLWTKDDGGFTPHLVSTISEWLLSFSYCAYIGTFIWEFRRIEVSAPVVKLRDVQTEVSTETGSQAHVNLSFESFEFNHSAQSLWI